MFPFNSWLKTHIDGYQIKLRDAKRDCYMAESALDYAENDVTRLQDYYRAGQSLLALSQQHGDDHHYLANLLRLHQRLILEINNAQRPHLFRLQSYQFARQTLQQACQFFGVQGCWRKVIALQTDFAQRVTFNP